LFAIRAVNTVPSILVGTADRTVLVRVEGKGTFLNSTGLKEFAKEMTNRGFRNFVVDLKNCPVMDSTFMGILAFVAMRLRKLGSGEMTAINLNERNRDLLCNLGLDQLFTIAVAEELPCAQPLPADPADKRTQKQTMLEAHEAVIAANPENAAKFKDVLEYLKQDLPPAQ
jgi:anti-sigma B factor antagonist